MTHLVTRHLQEIRDIQAGIQLAYPRRWNFLAVPNGGGDPEPIQMTLWYCQIQAKNLVLRQILG